MDFHALLFWVLAAAAVGAAAMLLLARSIVHLAFWLLASLAGFAGLYLHLGADFLGFTQVIVYIGGILILFLFGVMLTQREDVPVRRPFSWRVIVPGLLVGALIQVVVVVLVLTNGWSERPPAAVPALMPPGGGGAAPLAEPTAAEIGTRVLSTYILPFEVVSVLLVVAMVGATYVARSREELEEEGGGR